MESTNKKEVISHEYLKLAGSGRHTWTLHSHRLRDLGD
ncbi:hypothetical protein PP301_gp073 [Gordonia phage GMA2]|uniref:Uncharacterized protein n=1 Tax=Gordonia phage GMA2 TaxID=1647283 RepID=A0A0K0N6T6_9CAUD|nr:hypothetical protein PP301_gp073 [Gordonia phage GMA2]AKJ72649.1 hypothetical protein GMA2_111 [Gordonia phage GMA2]